MISTLVPRSVFVIDQENPGLTLTITPPQTTASFGGTIVPWCNSVDDVTRKAFKFFLQGVPTFFMFQRSFSVIAWTPVANPSFEQSRFLVGNASYIDVSIDANGDPSAVRIP